MYLNSSRLEFKPEYLVILNNIEYLSLSHFDTGIIKWNKREANWLDTHPVYVGYFMYAFEIDAKSANDACYVPGPCVLWVEFHHRSAREELVYPEGT